MDFVRKWPEKAEVTNAFIGFIGIQRGKFFDWQKRYGKVNEHNAYVPRDHWLTDDEKQAIIHYHLAHPLEGYRRLTFMMLDGDVVAVSPASVYRILSEGGYLNRWNPGPSRKGKGFDQPTRPHEHWHVDITYINISGTFYYLCAVIDGYSRYLVHWDIRPAMLEADIEVILQRATELHPGATPRIITDNGPQFIAKDFKEFIRVKGMTHVRTSPYYPQSNGKLERWNKTLKACAIQPRTPLSLDDARRIVEEFVNTYNKERLHSAIGYITPADKLAGREDAIFAERDRKLEDARALRAQRRDEVRRRACAIPAHQSPPAAVPSPA